MKKQQEEIAKAQGELNKKLGDAFLAANKTKEGVVTLPSGLQYKILQPGTGPKPTAKDVVVCNYRGTLLGGKEFDSSYKRGQPATFPMGQVIKGWTEALAAHARRLQMAALPAARPGLWRAQRWPGHYS